MSKVLVEESSLHGVGNGIRYVNGQNTTYKPAQFEAAIKSLKPVMGTKRITANGTFPASGDQLDGFSSVTVAVPPSSAVLVEKSVTVNGEYDAADDDADGYSSVTVEVPNTYEAGDEGKVVSEGELVSQTSKNITANGTHDTTTNDEVVVAVPNTYGAGDEGKVVSSGALVAQTSRNVNANGTVDTTTNNQVVVAVPNSYAAGDEGKVVSNGELVAQGSQTVTENGTYDTTLKNSVTVDVSGGGSGGPAYGIPTGYCELVAFGGGVFVTIGDGDGGSVSRDGVNWESVTLPRDIEWHGLAYGNGKFLAAGYSWQDEYVVIASSTDGSTWTLAVTGFEYAVSRLIYGNGKFVLFFGSSSQSSNKAAYSTDGTTWTEITLPVTWSGPLSKAIAWKTGLFFAGGPAGSFSTCLTSADGVTWTANTISIFSSVKVVAASESRFVALPGGYPASDTGYYSDDGVNWTAVTLPVSGSWGRVAYGNGLFMAVGDSNTPVLMSADGATWWQNTPVSPGGWDDMAFGSSRFVAVSDSHNTSMAYRISLVALTATENGSYTPPSGADGFSEVVVNVSGGLIEEWDFTGASPFVGTLLGLGFFDRTGVAAGAGGAVIDAASDRLVFAGSANGMTIEADVAATNLTASSNRRFVMADTSNGLVYRNTGTWGFYAGSWEMTEETNGDFFANSTVKVVIDSAGCWHIYKDGVLWFEPEAALPLGATVQIGSSSNSCATVTITGLRVQI